MPKEEYFDVNIEYAEFSQVDQYDEIGKIESRPRSSME
jgi:hypothetical protein